MKLAFEVLGPPQPQSAAFIGTDATSAMSRSFSKCAARRG